MDRLILRPGTPRPSIEFTIRIDPDEHGVSRRPRALAPHLIDYAYRLNVHQIIFHCGKPLFRSNIRDMYEGEKINFCHDQPACSKEYVTNYNQITRTETVPDIVHITFVACAFHTKETARELPERAMISFPHPRSILYAIVSRPQRMSAVQLDGTRL
jgi:hypothetical protein